MLAFTNDGHEQLHPEFEFPDTENAIPLQFAEIVQVSEQLGIVPLKAAAQELQSSVWLNCGAQVAHDRPDHWLRHVQTQLGSKPVTLVEWLLQSEATQIREQFGYCPAYPAAQEPQSALALYCIAQMEQFAPPHEFRHEQLQPFFVLPVTLIAFPEQFALVVHVR